MHQALPVSLREGLMTIIFNAVAAVRRLERFG